MEMILSKQSQGIIDSRCEETISFYCQRHSRRLPGPPRSLQRQHISRLRICLCASRNHTCSLPLPLFSLAQLVVTHSHHIPTFCHVPLRFCSDVGGTLWSQTYVWNHSAWPTCKAWTSRVLSRHITPVLLVSLVSQVGVLCVTLLRPDLHLNGIFSLWWGLCCASSVQILW